MYLFLSLSQLPSNWPLAHNRWVNIQAPTHHLNAQTQFSFITICLSYLNGSYFIIISLRVNKTRAINPELQTTKQLTHCPVTLASPIFKRTCSVHPHSVQDLKGLRKSHKLLSMNCLSSWWNIHIEFLHSMKNKNKKKKHTVRWSIDNLVLGILL